VTGELISTLLGRVSRSFYLSLAILPRAVRPTIALAYLFARAADTIADTRLIERSARIEHLETLRAQLDAAEAGRLEQIIRAVAGSQAMPAERELLERLPGCFAAYRALPADDRERVKRLLMTIIQGMTEDLRLFPGEDEDKLQALETRGDLDRYTYLVAGCAGEFWTDVHAAHRPRLRRWDVEESRGLGIRFGQGLQLTNILRDLPRDLRQGRCYLPRQDLKRVGLLPRDLLDPGAAPTLRPLLIELLGVVLDRYEAGWQYTLSIPVAEFRMRLACAWPLLIGLRTLALLVETPTWLDPAVTLKVPRAGVYGLITRSLLTVWSNRALAGQARGLRARIAL
jgi:farnesyl-diphosphate farnesyltransferase